MTCGLFLILHHVLCVLAIDPGTSTVSTETRILSGSVATVGHRLSKDVGWQLLRLLDSLGLTKNRERLGW